MAKPQLENVYTPIANEPLEHMDRLHLELDRNRGPISLRNEVGIEPLLSISFKFFSQEVSIIEIRCPEFPQIPTYHSDSPPDRG